MASYTGISLFVLCIAAAVTDVRAQSSERRYHVYALTFFNITTETEQETGISQFFLSSYQDVQTQIQIESLSINDYTNLDASNARQKNETRSFKLSLPAGGGIENNGVIIVTDGKANIQGARAAPGTTDAFLALPIVKSSKEFFIPSWETQTVGMAGLAIAAATSACVELYRVRNGSYERFWTLGMSRYEIFQQFERSAGVDITGYFINATGPIAVYSGHECAQVLETTRFCDHLIEQIPPVDQWGNVSIVGPVLGRLVTGGYTVRILAAHANTIIESVDATLPVFIERGHGCNCTGIPNPTMPLLFSDCTQECVIHTGEFVQFDVPDTSTAAVFQCNKPCLVVQYHRGLYAAGVDPSNIALESLEPDPSMVIATPIDHYSNQLSFATPNYVMSGETRAFQSYICVIAETSAQAGVILDDDPISGASWTPLPVGGYSYASIPISHGFHRLYHSDPSKKIMGFVYGHGNRDDDSSGYAFPAAYEIFGETLEGAWNEVIQPVDTTTAGVTATATDSTTTDDTKTCSKPSVDSSNSVDVRVAVAGRVTTYAGGTRQVAGCVIALREHVPSLMSTMNGLICQSMLCPGLDDAIYVTNVTVEILDVEKNELLLDVIMATSMDVKFRELAECRRQMAVFLTYWDIPDSSGDVQTYCGENIAASLAPTNRKGNVACPT